MDAPDLTRRYTAARVVEPPNAELVRASGWPSRRRYEVSRPAAHRARPSSFQGR
jgi:hypothetical protein